MKVAFTISENLKVFRVSVWTSKPVLRPVVRLSSVAACMCVPQRRAEKETFWGRAEVTGAELGQRNGKKF